MSSTSRHAQWTNYRIPPALTTRPPRRALGASSRHLTGTPYTRINFQPARHDARTRATIRTYGLIFAPAVPTAPEYGWKYDNTAHARSNNAASPDQRLRHLHSHDSAWNRYVGKNRPAQWHLRCASRRRRPLHSRTPTTASTWKEASLSWKTKLQNHALEFESDRPGAVTDGRLTSPATLGYLTINRLKLDHQQTLDTTPHLKPPTNTSPHPQTTLQTNNPPT